MGSLDEKRFKNFLSAEQKFITESKYYKGINLHKDPGDEYITECIEKKAKTFREMWNLSVCKNCVKAGKCGNNLRIDCANFEELT